MIARFATSPPVNDPDVEAQRRDNLERRLKPALVKAPGFRGGMWLKRGDGTVHSITLWDSEEALRGAQPGVDATPMQAGQRPEAMPGPATGQVVEIAEVIDFVIGERSDG